MRRKFAGTGATVLIDQTGANSNAVVTAWTSVTGGTRLTDLQDLAGQPVEFGNLQADNQGVVHEFIGPDDSRSELYLDGGLGRLLVQSNDIPARVLALESTAAVPTVLDGGGA